jgi:hypothetical protein
MIGTGAEWLGRKCPKRTSGLFISRSPPGRKVLAFRRWTRRVLGGTSQTRGGIGGARARRHPGPRFLGGGAVAAGDPHGADRVPGRCFVDSLARPGGNATGFGAHTSVANKILPSRMQLDLNDVTLNQWGPRFEPG